MPAAGQRSDAKAEPREAQAPPAAAGPWGRQKYRGRKSVRRRQTASRVQSTPAEAEQEYDKHDGQDAQEEHLEVRRHRLRAEGRRNLHADWHSNIPPLRDEALLPRRNNAVTTSGAASNWYYALLFFLGALIALPVERRTPKLAEAGWHARQYMIKPARWRVPSEERAFDGWLEGAPSAEQRAAILAEVRRERENWVPSEEAWGQLRELERFIGRRARIQFWDPIMFLLEDEGPYPILADCRGITLLRPERFLQAYLVLDHIEQLPNSLGYPPDKFINTKLAPGWKLAPIAELLEITAA